MYIIQANVFCVKGKRKRIRELEKHRIKEVGNIEWALLELYVASRSLRETSNRVKEFYGRNAQK